MQASRPWGLSRMAPFPGHEGGGGRPYRVMLHPETQTAVRLDLTTGVPIEAKHGSNVEQATATTPPTGDGGNAPNGGPDTTTDWVCD